MAKKHVRKDGAEKAAETLESPQDNSPYVFQRNKIKNPIWLRSLKWTDKQKAFFEIANKKDMRVMLIKGPAGSSKTFLSVFSALKLLNERKISDLIYLRSAVESSDAHIGHLPGSQEEKMAVYNAPFYDKLEEITNKQDRDFLFKDARLNTVPINFIRGLSWNSKAIIGDEMQNSTQKEIITILTRLGHFSRCFLLADPQQSDLNGKSGGFERIYNLFHNKESAQNMGIYTFEFTSEDVVRSELVAYITKELENLPK